MAQTVKIYTTQACRHCQTVKEYLNRSGIAYREIDVRRSRSGFKTLQRKQGAGAPPVITLDGRVFF
jgi:glutaredoxin